jgi:hypothetical protein
MTNTANSIRSRISESVIISDLTGGAAPISRGQVGVLVDIFNRYTGNDDHRYLALAWLFSKEKELKPMSSKSLSLAQLNALWNWAKPEKIEATWLPCMEFQADILLVLDAALKEFHRGIDQSTRAGFDLQAEEPSLLTDAIGNLDGRLLAITDITPGRIVSNQDCIDFEVESDRPHRERKTSSASAGITRPIRPIRPKGGNPFG